MKQKEVFYKIGGIIQELSDQYEYLKTADEDLNDLELELFAANAHFLTDHIEVLYKLNLQNEGEKRKREKPAKPEKSEKPETPAKTPATDTLFEPKYFEPVVQQMKPALENQTEKTAKGQAKPVEPEIANAGKSVDSHEPETGHVTEALADGYSFSHEEPEVIRHELVLDETMLEEDEKAEIEAEPAKESKRRKTALPATEEPVFDLTGQKPEEAEKAAETPAAIVEEEEVLTINQKMSQAAEKNLSRTEQLSIKPISDIKLAITLNDKLLYVKDLFNGYNLAYSEAVEILNRFSTFDEAARFLKTNYVTKNNWESKPATVEKFYALLKRRYA
ncbi:MAG TPA: hypothetical protein VFE53_16470 [Mucilaginibacter sp.]|jgi:hypothetical protein|nr:hypothetical protein [Mucilaginibacter sp.]